jgi:GT2 family glycosyltransferase
MKSSVIIPVWNGRQHLPACLDALLAQDYPDFEVIAVDNASTDGSADFVARNYPKVRLIRNKRNLGFAGGCNVGLRAAQGDILMLLNQDTSVRPGWLQVLAEALQEPGVGVAGCKILYPDGKTIQHAGGWIEWPWGLARHHGQGEQDTGQWDVSRSVEYVTGAAMAFRRDVLDQVGLLDEGFWPGYFEDSDFCFRVRETGYEVWYIPDAVLVHKENTSLTDPLAISRACQRGRLRFLLKHMSPYRFLAEFVPAEEEGELPGIWGQERSHAYFEAMPMVVSLLHHRWQADKRMIREVLIAMQRLYQRAWEENWKKVEESVAAIMPLPASSAPGSESSVPSVTSLQELEFHSTVPIVGPLITRFRSLWYSVAARWAVRHLIQQQEAINRQQEVINQQQEVINQQQDSYIQALKRHLTELVDENALLAREVANLSMQIYERVEKDGR